MPRENAQECGATGVITGVTVQCHRTKGHNGAHGSRTYGTRWHDTGEIVTPPRSRQAKPMTCREKGCSLWPDHAGPHGHQEVIPL